MFEPGTDLVVPAKGVGARYLRDHSMILPVGVLGVGRHVWVFFPLVEDAVRLRGSVPLDLVVVGCLLPLDEPAIAGRRRIK